MIAAAPALDPNGRNDGLNQRFGRGTVSTRGRRALFLVKYRHGERSEERCGHAFGHCTAVESQAAMPKRDTVYGGRACIDGEYWCQHPHSGESSHAFEGSMPKSHRQKPLYQRGNFRLDRRPDRKNLVITRYDAVRKREREFSARTADVEAAKRALDARYLADHGSGETCPTCGQPVTRKNTELLTSVIADYIVSQTELIVSPDTIRYRLAHVVSYVEMLPKIPKCDEIDENWVQRFRKWAIRQPIISKGGNARPRSEATVEGSVRQLAAAINWGYAKEKTQRRAQFTPVPPRLMGGTPAYRAEIDDLIAMFRYASDPSIAKHRQNLLRFLRISVATWARPDAAHDVSTDPERKQWNPRYRILNLNPHGRLQTKKHRPILPVVHHVADELDVIDGYYVKVNSVKAAFKRMAAELGLPADGESGMKLIRRSMANLVRSRLPMEQHVEVEAFLGHRVFDQTSDLYAPFSPNYLRNALQVIENICDEIEAAVPTAFYRSFTAQRPQLRTVNGGKNA